MDLVDTVDARCARHIKGFCAAPRLHRVHNVCFVHKVHVIMKHHWPSTSTSPEAAVTAMERSATVARTPCGSGTMVWHLWGSGTPLVLLHGGSGSWNHWLRNIPALAQRYRLLVADLPGMGDSDEAAEPQSPHTIADAVAAGLRQLIAGFDKPHLAGFSFGGHIAGLTALRLGADALRDLTLIGVESLGFPGRNRRPFAKERPGMSAAQIDAVYHANLADLMFADPANIDALAVHLQKVNIRRVRFKSPPWARTEHLRDALRELRLPVKSIWGGRDVVATPSVAARIERLREHHPELVARVIEGAGHWVMYEAAEEFDRALVEVLEDTQRP
jgi:pimeloyl-ACP methyl ester carboxylesterase